MNENWRIARDPNDDPIINVNIKTPITVIAHPEILKEGVRVLLLTSRTKDGGEKGRSVKLVSRDINHFNDKLNQLLELMEPNQRIYSTVEKKDTEKAIRMFKQNQLDAEYYDEDSRKGFYHDVWNRWISCLQKPQSSVSKLFLVDIDPEDDEKAIMDEIETNKLTVVWEYATKNGRHVILEPFNPSKVSFEVKRNDMILLAYS